MTTTLISVKPRRSGSDPVEQGGCGSTASVIAYPVGINRFATAGPEKLSPFLNVADQVPISAFGV